VKGGAGAAGVWRVWRVCRVVTRGDWCLQEGIWEGGWEKPPLVQHQPNTRPGQGGEGRGLLVAALSLWVMSCAPQRWRPCVATQGWTRGGVGQGGDGAGLP
jgi:hypothetical protein